MNGKLKMWMRRLGKAAFDADHPAAAALAIIGRTPLAGALTSTKTALTGTLNQTFAMILHEYLLFIILSRKIVSRLPLSSILVSQDYTKLFVDCKHCLKIFLKFIAKFSFSHLPLEITDPALTVSSKQ